MATKCPWHEVRTVEVRCGQWLEVEVDYSSRTTILRALLAVTCVGRHALLGPPESLAIPALRQTQGEIRRFTAHGLLAFQIVHMA